MFNITKYLLKTRDFTKKHFGVSLEMIKYKNDLYSKKWFIITKIIPFIIVKFILDLLKTIYILLDLHDNQFRELISFSNEG